MPRSLPYALWTKSGTRSILVPASKGIPTIATSQLSTSLSSGNLAKVDGPANLGTLVPLTGWMGFLFFFKVLVYFT